jgi:multidrug efflux system membrane fusion protein
MKRSNLFNVRVTAAVVVTVAALATTAVLLPSATSAKASDHAGSTAAPPAAAVDVAQVQSRPVVDFQHFSGRLEAVDNVEIRPLVSGTLTTVHFRDGSMVRKGDPLFTIDARPYAAEAARMQAQLAGAQARAAYTASDLARGQRLLDENAIARRDFDEKQNAAREAAAAVQMAQAALQSAQLNLAHCRIVAPVSGRISRAEITPGNVVAAGSAAAPLATLVSMARIYASFAVDEQSFLKYINPGRPLASDNAQIYLKLANEDTYARQGQLSSVDNHVDTSSGTVRIRAVFDNPQGLLLPGLYAQIRLGSGDARDAILIDDKAIGTDQDKRFVLVVDEANRTAYREVQVGAEHEGLRLVTRGLVAGERIVVNGLQRVRPGDVVAPKPVAMNRTTNPEQGDGAGKRQADSAVAPARS